jgi:hypothetical protein
MENVAPSLLLRLSGRSRFDDYKDKYFTSMEDWIVQRML